MKDETRGKLYNFLDKNERKLIIITAIIVFITTFYISLRLYQIVDLNPSKSRKNNRHAGDFLANSFNYAIKEYKKKYKKKPKVFSELITDSKAEEKSYTININYLKEERGIIKDISSLNSDTLTVYFAPDGSSKRVYYLKDGKVTASKFNY